MSKFSGSFPASTTDCLKPEISCSKVGIYHSDYPPEVVSGLPRLGPDLGIDVAAVARLEPDLVLASLTVPGHEKVVEALADAGLSPMAPDPVSLDDVYRDIREIAARFGVSGRGEQLIREMQTEIVSVPSDAGPRPGVLVEWWPRPVIVPGRKSWVQDLLVLAGGRNPFGDRNVESTPVEPEEVVAVEPDAVIISWCGVDPEKYRPKKVYEREGWGDLPALRNGRVHCVPEAFLGRPGPRLVEGYRRLKEIVADCRRGNHPEPGGCRSA